MRKIRFFKPGERVEIKDNLKSPVLEVIKYVDDYLVECVYYVDHQRKVENYHEKRLIKSDKPGLFKV